MPLGSPKTSHRWPFHGPLCNTGGKGITPVALVCRWHIEQSP